MVVWLFFLFEFLLLLKFIFFVIFVNPYHQALMICVLSCIQSETMGLRLAIPLEA